MKLKDYAQLLLCILIAQAAGIVGSLFTAPAIDSWYVDLIKPELAPPNWVFAPVWTILFIWMGIALYIVWSKGVRDYKVKVALGVFSVQLVLNTLWSIIFFGLQSPGLALVEMAFLWVAILATIYTFARVSKVASWLLVPYIAWVSFAFYLNLMIFWLN